MQFDAFCRAHGLILDGLPPVGRWVRYPTTDHPRTRNGAAKYLGEIGWVQNHAQQVDVSVWRPEREMPAADMRRIHAQVAQFDEHMRAGWARAAARAGGLLASAVQAEHNYLHYKGFGDEPGTVARHRVAPRATGLVLPDGALMVPMRHWRSNALVGAQLIRWDAEAMTYEKKMLPGMRAKGAVLRLGSATAGRTWLVEGYATGLSVAAATGLLRLRDAVLICFSAGNLIHVARQLGAGCVVFADNDESGAGERAAVATGLPYVMSPVIGEDANDMHVRAGICKVAELMLETQIAEAPA